MQIDDFPIEADAGRRIIVYSTTSLAPEPAELTADRRIIVYSTTSFGAPETDAHLPSSDWMF